MKAVAINPDKSLRYGDVPDPVCAKDEVLIKVAYAALNRADLMQREGVYPPPPGAPDWPGLEVSGEVAACGARFFCFMLYKINFLILKPKSFRLRLCPAARRALLFSCILALPPRKRTRSIFPYPRRGDIRL